MESNTRFRFETCRTCPLPQLMVPSCSPASTSCPRFLPRMEGATHILRSGNVQDIAIWRWERGRAAASCEDTQVRDQITAHGVFTLEIPCASSERSLKIRCQPPRQHETHKFTAKATVKRSCECWALIASSKNRASSSAAGRDGGRRRRTRVGSTEASGDPTLSTVLWPTLPDMDWFSPSTEPDVRRLRARESGDASWRRGMRGQHRRGWCGGCWSTREAAGPQHGPRPRGRTGRLQPERSMVQVKDSQCAHERDGGWIARETVRWKKDSKLHG